jgi:hypothetical protein
MNMQYIANLLCSLCAYCAMIQAQKQTCRSALCIPTDYDQSVNPKGLTEVGVVTSLNQIMRVNDNDGTVVLSVFLIFNWTDPRLTTNISDVSSFGYQQIDDKLIDRIWLPDIYMYGMEKISFLKVLRASGGI